MDYFKHYNKLVKRGQARVSAIYTESHHIIPRCLGGSDAPDNLVNLTPEEHYVAHQLLVKMYPENTSLAFAANMMCANRSTNKSYGWVRRKISEAMKNDNPNKDGEVNRNRKGKYNLSNQAKINISEGMRKHKVNHGEKNGMYSIQPWNHPRATEQTISMWARADEYYEWWINSGLEHGQNAMARHFNEKYASVHHNLIKKFRTGWIPIEDKDWLNIKEEIQLDC